MSHAMICPKCAASFQVAREVRGKKAFCPGCGLALVIPGRTPKRIDVHTHQDDGTISLPVPAAVPPIVLLLAWSWSVTPKCALDVMVLS